MPGPAPDGHGPLAQELAFQTSLNELPAELSGPGLARTFFAVGLLIMVISSSRNDLIVPDLVPAFTAAAVTVQVLNLASETGPELMAGLSPIHSALLFLQPPLTLQVGVLVKLLPEVVESVTLIVYLVPLLTTDAEILSPGFTVTPTAWMLLVGNSSHHVKYTKGPKSLPQATPVPACSTVLELKPSRPTQKISTWSLPVALQPVTLGTVHAPVTELK